MCKIWHLRPRAPNWRLTLKYVVHGYTHTVWFIRNTVNTPYWGKSYNFLLGIDERKQSTVKVNPSLKEREGKSGEGPKRGPFCLWLKWNERKYWRSAASHPRLRFNSGHSFNFSRDKVICLIFEITFGCYFQSHSTAYNTHGMFQNGRDFAHNYVKLEVTDVVFFLTKYAYFIVHSLQSTAVAEG